VLGSLAPLTHIAGALDKLGDTLARHIPEIDRFADAVGQTIGRAIDAAAPRRCAAAASP
jgi:hypothetical protein